MSCARASSDSCERLLGGAVLDARGVEARGERGVGVPHEAHRDLPGILGGGGLELVDVPGGEAELELDVGDRRAGADPELAVAGVGEELVAVAVGERAEVEHRLVAGRAVVAGDRLHDEHGIRLAVGPEAGQPGERGVRAEDVVGVVAAHLEAAGGDDEPLPRVGRAEHRPAGGGVRRRGGRAGGPGPAGGPALLDEGSELVGRRPAPVVCLLLLLAHRPHAATSGWPVRPVEDCPDGSAQRAAPPRPCRHRRGGGPRGLGGHRLGGRGGRHGRPSDAGAVAVADRGVRAGRHRAHPRGDELDRRPSSSSCPAPRPRPTGEVAVAPRHRPRTRRRAPSPRAPSPARAGRRRPDRPAARSSLPAWVPDGATS